MSPYKKELQETALHLIYARFTLYRKIQMNQKLESVPVPFMLFDGPAPVTALR